MKKIILSVAILSMAFANAQEKEVKAASEALMAQDIGKVKMQIAAAEAKMNGNASILTPEYQEQYYLAKGFIMMDSKNFEEAANMIGKISEMGTSKIYSGKNSNRDKVYFIGKKAADASGISDLKEETYQPKSLEVVKQFVNPMLQSASKAAVEAYNAKNYTVAGAKFKEVSNLLKAIGENNGQYLYNAAISYGLANDLKNANEIFTQLIDSGYTGVETTYTAKNNENGQITSFTKTMWELSKKDARYSDFKSETSKSVESDIYDAAVKIQMDDQKYDQALKSIEKGLAKFPKNTYLAEQRGIAYYKTGKTAEFVTSLKDQVANNPNDSSAWYNLGVLQNNDPATKMEAKKAFLKAVELDPTMKNAYQNLTYLEMGDDDKTIAEYEALKKAGKMEEANTVLKKRKERFGNALPYAEKWYNADSTSVNAVGILKNLYLSTGNDAKFKEFKAKEDAMSK